MMNLERGIKLLRLLDCSENFFSQEDGDRVLHGIGFLNVVVGVGVGVV